MNINIKFLYMQMELKIRLPQDILIKLIKLFSFDLDFQRDIKKYKCFNII